MSNIDKLVAEFLKGTCSAEQADLLCQYFAEYPDEMEKYFSEEEWNTLQHEYVMPQNISTDVWENIAKILPDNTGSKRVYKWKRMMAVATVILLLPLAGVIYYQINISTDKSFSDNQPFISKINVNNVNDHSLEHKLPDGSVIILENGASVTYDSIFSPKERRIVLSKGKAFFDVVSNPSHPFVVQSENITTTALGTSFFVDNKIQEQSILVQLVSGKVALRNEDEKIVMTEIVLKPGQQCFIDQKTMHATLSNFKTITLDSADKKSIKDTPKNTARKPVVSQWEYYKKPLGELLDELSRYYKCTIEYNEEEMSQVYFTGNLDKKDSLQKNIRIICMASGIDFEFSGDTLIVKRKPVEIESE